MPLQASSEMVASPRKANPSGFGRTTHDVDYDDDDDDDHEYGATAAHALSLSLSLSLSLFLSPGLALSLLSPSWSKAPLSSAAATVCTT